MRYIMKKEFCFILLAYSLFLHASAPASIEEGFVDSDTLIIAGRGQTNQNLPNRTRLQREATAFQSARQDAESRLVEICVTPRAACGQIDAESLLKAKELRRAFRSAKEIHRKCDVNETEQAITNCTIFMRLQLKGLKILCASTSDNQGIPAGCTH